MGKIGALLDLFRKGNSVADPALWKNRQITATVLGAFLMALFHVAESFGLKLPITSADTDALAGGVLVVVNLVLTVTTTDKIGLSAKPEGGSQAGPDSSHTD